MPQTLTSDNTVLSRGIKLLCMAAAAAMAIASVVIYKAPAASLLLLAAYMLFYVQLPGSFVLRYLRPEFGHLSTVIITGFFTGWVVELLLYFISDALKSNILLYVLPPLLSAALIVSMFKKDGKRRFSVRKTLDGIPLSFMVFIILILFYCLVNTQYLYIAPAVSDFTYVNPDKAYHMGLINSLSHDYPLESPWVSGVFINYHIFTEILFSIPVREFGISADVITQSFGPFLTTYVFGLALYAFYREMTSRPERAGGYCLLTILSNVFIARNISTSLAFVFVLINDNSSGYGLAAVLVSIIVFKYWYAAFRDGREGQMSYLILLTAFVMLATGIKGPMGAVVAASLWGVMILGVILRSVKLKAFIPLLAVTAGFLLIYVVVLGSKGQSNASGDSMFAFATIADITFWKKPLVHLMKVAHIPKTLRLCVLMFVFMVFLLTVFFIPFCIGYIRELILVLTKRKEYMPERILVYAAFAAGLVAMMILNYSGHSQVYFGLVSAFTGPVIAFWFLEDMEKSGESSALARNVLKATLCIMAVGIVCTTGSLAKYYVSHAEDAIRHMDPSIVPGKYLSISNDEYQAMEWIEENTEEDALLATDRYYSVARKKYDYDDRWDNRFFLYEVYSNRFSYISGSGYNLPNSRWKERKEMIETNNKLYDESYEDRGRLARDLGVDYVVVSKRFSGSPDLTNGDYEKCYSNDEVDVYRIAE